MQTTFRAFSFDLARFIAWDRNRIPILCHAPIWVLIIASHHLWLHSTLSIQSIAPFACISRCNESTMLLRLPSDMIALSRPLSLSLTLSDEVSPLPYLTPSPPRAYFLPLLSSPVPRLHAPSDASLSLRAALITPPTTPSTRPIHIPIGPDDLQIDPLNHSPGGWMGENEVGGMIGCAEASSGRRKTRFRGLGGSLCDVRSGC